MNGTSTKLQRERENKNKNKQKQKQTKTKTNKNERQEERKVLSYIIVVYQTTSARYCTYIRTSTVVELCRT